MSSDKELSPTLVSEMLDDCLKAVIAWEDSDEAKAIEDARHLCRRTPND